MKKFISGVLSAVMLTSVLCACNDGGNQSNASQSGNNADSSQQTVTTEAATTQPATEPNYKDTNYVAPIPPKNQTYKFEEISLDDAATSSGYSIDDSKFRIYNASVQGGRLEVCVTYSDEGSSDYCKYYAIYDLEGNMIANISNVSLDEGYDKSVEVRGVYKDYVIVSFNVTDSENKYALYNMKTKELKYIDSQYYSAYLYEGAIIVSKECAGGNSGFKYGAFNLNLDEIIPVEYDKLNIASPDRFIALKDNYYGLIDFNNNVVADFKYKEICDFSGISFDSIEQLDFENNINQYTVARDKNKKAVLIDKNGNIVNDNLETTEEKLSSGRTVAQYGDKTFITYENSISDTNGNLITDTAKVVDYDKAGFINGYCITRNDNGECELIDSKGKIVFSKPIETEYEIRCTPVDQKGLFKIDYYSNSDSNYVKTEILDLSGNVVTTQYNSFGSVGHGIFTQGVSEKQDYKVYKLTAE